MAAKKKSKKKKTIKKSKPKKQKKSQKAKKRKSVKRPKAKKAKKAKPKKVVARPEVSKSKPMPGAKLVGRVTHYFPHVNAAVIVVGSGSLKLGEEILIKGHTTHVQQRVVSMQIDHVPITEAKKRNEIGLQVDGRVREHDLVYKVG